MTDKATPTPASVDSVCELLNICCVTFAKWKELGKRGRTAEEEDTALREMRDAQENFRVEVERLAAQAAPTEPPQEFESAQGRALASAWAEGWAQCRDAEYVGEEAESEAFNQSYTLAQCLHADQTRLQGGLSNDQLRRAWGAKLPRVIPTDEQLAAFALGIEFGVHHPQQEQSKCQRGALVLPWMGCAANCIFTRTDMDKATPAAQPSQAPVVQAGRCGRL